VPWPTPSSAAHIFKSEWAADAGKKLGLTSAYYEDRKLRPVDNPRNILMLLSPIEKLLDDSRLAVMVQGTNLKMVLLDRNYADVKVRGARYLSL